MNVIFFHEDALQAENLLARFVKSLSNISIFYSPWYREYSLHYLKNTIKKDLSFIIVLKDQPIAYVPLYLEEINGKLQFSYADSYLKAPLINNQLEKKQNKKAQQLTIKMIDQLAKEYSVTKYLTAIDPVSQINEHFFSNWLTKYNFLDTSAQTQIIDLKKLPTELWLEVRKSYRPLINKAKQCYQLCIWDYKNAEWEMHEQYRMLHHKAAGRITRPLETFALQFEQMKRDESILIGLRWQEKWIAFSAFWHLNNHAFYASTADDPEAMALPAPIGPLIIWQAIEYYKNRNFHFLETGLQQHGPQLLDFPSQKDINISGFKRALGGNTHAIFRGIKYYCKETLGQDLTKISTNLLASYNL